MNFKSPWAIGGAVVAMLLSSLVLLGGILSADQEAAAACGSAAVGDGSGFAIGTLNWRGAHHFHSNPYRREQPYSKRVPYMVAAIDGAGVSIVGFQEFESVQARAFLQATNGSWAIIRGRIRGKANTADSIAYRPAQWSVDVVRYVSVPYGHHMVQIPLARFTSTAGLGTIWVLNTHNPAKHVGGTDAMRDVAVRTEAAVLKSLASSGTPVLFTGDMNDHDRFRQLFLAKAGSGWSAANPDAARVDWIMGGPGVSFSGTVVDQSVNDNAYHYTDHPFVHTVVSTAAAAVASSEPAESSAHRTIPRPAPQTVSRKASQPQVDGFTTDQVSNATAVLAAGKALNVPPRGLAIGLMTAYGESKLHNINYGDRDSIGIFQQRDNGAWGTAADRMDPYIAASNFFKALLRVPAWQDLSPTLAAHAVQANADPNYYAQFWPAGLKLLQALDGTAAVGSADPVAVNCPTSSTDTGTSQIAFTASGQPYVGQFTPDQLMARAQAYVAAGTVDVYFHTVPSTDHPNWYRLCQHFVANLSGRSSSGYGSASDGWAAFVATNAAHPAKAADGQSPPVGAWLYFKSSSSAAGHVAVYLGNNLIASTDLPTSGRIGIVAADAPVTQWHQTYLGWAAPWGAPNSGSKAQ